MLIPPEGYRREGWKVWTVGDDICWMRPGADGRLYAINPEAGFFGVAPGTSAKDQPECASDARNTTPSSPMSRSPPTTSRGGKASHRHAGHRLAGRDYDPANGPAAHPNSRFTVSANQCPSWSPKAENARACRSAPSCSAAAARSLLPLVMEARDWTHGVLMGAAMGSETTAAATGAGRRAAPRPDGHEAVLRLPLRRLLRALAVVRPARREAAEGLPRQLVPQGRRRQVPVARASATTCACSSGC